MKPSTARALSPARYASKTGAIAARVDEHALRAERRHRQRRLHEHEGLHHLRGVQGELERDVPAGGVPDEVRPLDPELAHQPSQVGRLLRDAHRPGHAAAARIADAVVAHARGIGR